MKHVSILVPECAELSSVEDPRYLFTAVNQFLQEVGEAPAFEVYLVAPSPQVRLQGGQYTVHTDRQIQGLPYTDLILIPILTGDLELAVKDNRQFRAWMLERYQEGAQIASLCTGAFLLASTGLMTGKRCATHWAYAQTFREMFPEVNLDEEKIMAEDAGLYSSGGTQSYWNLLLYLVEKFTRREFAVRAAKYFAVDLDRQCQSPFMVFNAPKEHGDEIILQAQDYIEAHFPEKLTVDTLCNCLDIPRRSLERRFKKATHHTTGEYIQKVKVEAAKKALESTMQSLEEIMQAVGYSDPKAFRAVFRKMTGLSPVEYRKKFNPDAAIWV